MSDDTTAQLRRYNTSIQEIGECLQQIGQSANQTHYQKSPATDMRVAITLRRVAHRMQYNGLEMFDHEFDIIQAAFQALRDGRRTYDDIMLFLQPPKSTKTLG